MEILVIDGQGGKMGSALVEQILAAGIKNADVIAVGTNSTATAAMVKAGAHAGATGENPVVVNSRTADVIVGPLGIIAADSLLGEVTPAMAVAVGQSGAHKVLLPVNRCNHIIVGVQALPMAQLVQQAVQQIEALAKA